MVMFKWANTVRSSKGDALVDWQVECVDLADGETVIPIFSDENGTPILSVSGIENRAKADAAGNYFFFAEEGIYSLRFYDDVGRFRRLDRYFTMFGAGGIALTQSEVIPSIQNTDTFVITRGGETKRILATDLASFIGVAAPVFTTSPSISGEAMAGKTLTGNDGVVSGGSILSRQWLRGTTSITGADSNTYVLVPADVGSNISYSVIASGTGGTTPAVSPSVGPVTEFTPSASWTGVAGSGGSAPTDPARTTAKPVCRILVAPNQTITDTLTVGVFAAANNVGSLANNLGMSHVTFHLEGNTQQVDAPSFRSFTRADGSTYNALGWWVDIAKPAGTEGLADLYVEAVPADGTMQSRVVGPHTFLMYDTEFDYDVTVRADGTGDYTTLAAARTYLRGQSAQRPQITITEAGTYDPGDSGGNYAGDGYLTITATAPVTIAQSAPATEATFQRIRTKYDRMHFKGSNITIDMVNSLQFYTETDGRYHWFDGINIVQSAGRDDLWRLRPRNQITEFARFGAYITDCNIQDLHDWGDKARLARGNVTNNTWGDALQDARCSVYNMLDDHSSFGYYQNIDAVTIRYTGSAATATVTLNGGNMNARTLRLYEDDVEIDTFSIENSSAAFTANTNYTCQNVVDWINTHTGWTATLNDNTRFAAALTEPGSTNGSGFIKLDAKTADLVLPTHFDIHSDVYQLPNLGAPRENVVFAFNEGFQIDAQDIFITGDNAANDFMFICNAFANNLGGADEALVSQLDHTHSHVVVSHNSLSAQDIQMRNDLDYDGDGYCLVTNNVLRDLTVGGGGSVDADITVANNHIWAESVSGPTGATGTSVGGDSTTLFVSAINGNFTPAGDLLTNTVAPVVPYDLSGAEFPNPTEKGAVA